MTETQTAYPAQDTESFYRSFFEPAPKGWEIDPLKSNEPWWKTANQTNTDVYIGLSR